MSLFQGLGAVVYKELRQIRRDPATLFLALLIPVVQLFIFGVAIDTEVWRLPTAVVDRACTEDSRAFRRALEATGIFRVVAEVPDRDAALGLLRAGRVKVAVLFPDDLPERLLGSEPAAVQFLIDGSDANTAQQAQMAAVSVAAARSGAADGASATPRFEARPRLLYNPDGRSETFFVPGLAGIILQLVTMVLTAFGIVRERERGTLEQLLVTPVSPLGLTLGKILPAILLGSAATLLVLGAMTLVFDVPIRGAVGTLAAACAIFLFTSLALGLLISSLAANQLQALMMTMLVLLPSVLLSGFMFPRANIPSPLLEVTYLIPATYFVEIMRGIVLRGASASDLVHAILPLAGLGAGLFLLAAFRLRRLLA